MFDHNHFSALVEQHKDELLQLCSDLIKIPSVNPPGEMEAITSFICGYLDKITAFPMKSSARRPRRRTSSQRSAARGGRRLILNGHADVVPPGNLEKWDFDPFCGDIRDGPIFGRGAS